jgi:hypothetical protein
MLGKYVLHERGLNKAVKICVAMPAVELQQAPIGSVCHSHKKRLGIRTEGYSCNLTKQVNLLAKRILLLSAIDMNKVCRLCHDHEEPIS